MHLPRVREEAKHHVRDAVRQKEHAYRVGNRVVYGTESIVGFKGIGEQHCPLGGIQSKREI